MNKTQRDAAKAFAAANVRDLAIELREWQDTGLLRDGKLRELAAILPDGVDALDLAEGIAIRACLNVVAGHGAGITVTNAAPPGDGSGSGGRAWLLTAGSEQRPLPDRCVARLIRASCAFRLPLAHQP